MSYSTNERIAHVYRRLGMGAHPDLVESTGDLDGAVARALQTGWPPFEPPDVEVPMDPETATDIATLGDPISWWLGAMVATENPIEERLVWFWHDHFATAVRKVRIPYLMWQQHLTIRRHATTSFADLLHAMSQDPAMLFYLDGARNHRNGVNENYAREVMELHTMGTGHYSQEDVTEAAKALTGWVVNVPYNPQARRVLSGYDPWQPVYVPARHHEGETTILGISGHHEPSDVIDILLDQPATAEFIAWKLWNELVGEDPDADALDTLSERFRSSGYSIMALVEDVVSHPGFTSDGVIRTKIRTPLERLVTIAQGFGASTPDPRLGFMLHNVAYLPFNPPSPAGYPKGELLLGPHQLVHAFDLLAVAEEPGEMSVEEVLARIGLFDVTEQTREVLELAPDPGSRLALAINSPEFAWK